MPRTLPSDLAHIAIFFPDMDEEFEMPLEEERKTKDKFFLLESFAFMHFYKELNLRHNKVEGFYYVETENKMTIGIHLKDVDNNIKRLMETHISGQEVGISFLLSNIEATAHVVDVLMGEILTIELRW